MKFVIISDTHTRFDKDLPDGDVLIHCGDYSLLPKWAPFDEQVQELLDFNKPLEKFKDKYAYILYTSGNHDLIFEKSPKIAKNLLTNAITLNDKEIVLFNQIKVYGTPSQPPFCDWGFNHDSNLRAHKYNNIPEDTNILITHCPPIGILDSLDDGTSVGCPILKRRIKDLSQLKMHCWGHIHESAGQVEENGVQYINASICTKHYNPTNPAIVVEYEQKEEKTENAKNETTNSGETE
tara:strand:- start:563 stop:1273 length:711 start_codon:yes stop_codon:yes gene_type:complete